MALRIDPTLVREVRKVSGIEQTFPDEVLKHVRR
jgi:hypothetical protein